MGTGKKKYSTNQQKRAHVYYHVTPLLFNKMFTIQKISESFEDKNMENREILHSAGGGNVINTAIRKNSMTGHRCVGLSYDPVIL